MQNIASHHIKCRTSHAAGPFLAWGYFHACSLFARSTISEEKWGTTRSLQLIFTFHFSGLIAGYTDHPATEKVLTVV